MCISVLCNNVIYVNNKIYLHKFLIFAGITGERRKTALYTPTECDAFSNNASWQEVSLGQHHSLALDSNGQVYAVGRCEYGRLVPQ